MNATIIARIAKKLHLRATIVQTFLSLDFGSQLIVDKNLHTTEVELSMFLKTLRKKLYYPYLHTLNVASSYTTKLDILKTVYKTYKNFQELHHNYFFEKNTLDNITTMLGDQLIFDSGIPQDRFEYLLPIFLKKVTPHELELIYSVNTLYRLEIAKKIQSKFLYPIYIRGSLLFFNARSFGIGYSANFSMIEKFEPNGKYDTASGSDLDLRILNNKVTLDDLNHLKNYVIKINKNHQTHNLSFIVETALQRKSSNDDVINIKESNLLIETYLKLMYATRNNLLITSNYPVIDKVKSAKLKKKDTKEKFLLTKSNIEKFVEKFKVVIQTSGANDEIVKHFSPLLKDLLIKGRMETDFHGYIDIKKLRDAFFAVFLFSGYRFTEKDADYLFTQIVDEL